MELRNIETFMCVAEKGSFTKAAEELGYVQSTVSVQIMQLEEELGMPLFERTGRHIAITSGGQCFLAYARQIVQLIEESKWIGRRMEDVPGQLRVGIVESLLEWVLSECIPKFNTRFPKMSIETKTSSGKELLQMLKRNELDFIFLIDKKTIVKNCKRVFAANESVVFVTHPSHPLAAKKSVPLQQVLQYALILTEKDSIYRRLLDENAAGKDLQVSPLLEINSTAAIIKLLLKESGISFLPAYTVRKEAEEGNLAILQVEGYPLQLWSQIFHREDKWVTPQMDALIKMVREYYKKAPEDAEPPMF